MSEDKEQNVSNGSVDCEDNSDTITLGDILKAEEVLKENAEAVLGPGDDKNCTSNEGYKKRQALYSCLTCTPAEGPELAGICLACSYHCHGDHDLVELFTKRNFKCDCGNGLFKGKCCFLDPAKSGFNERNTYNHNFKGIYCTCKRPYPDPENDDEDEMMQCIICEDWYHSKHVGSTVPKHYAEMICNTCTDKLPFLQYYLGHSITNIGDSDDQNDSSINISITDMENSISSSEKQVVVKCSSNNELSSNSTVNGDSSVQECLLTSLKKIPREGGATFWPSNFRKLLCTCNTCIEMYKEHNVTFLPDESDTVEAYEEEGKYRREQQVGVEAPESDGELHQILGSLDRVQQMEAILGYNDLKSNLKDFLAKFVENKKVVREEDVHEFFSGMQARKRRKLNIPPNNCR